MAKPAWKSPAMNQALEHMFKNSRIASIESDTCSNCSGPAEEFTDELSKREFTISGLCQKCQDIAFAPFPEDE